METHGFLPFLPKHMAGRPVTKARGALSRRVPKRFLMSLNPLKDFETMDYGSIWLQNGYKMWLKMWLKIQCYKMLLLLMQMKFRKTHHQLTLLLVVFLPGMVTIHQNRPRDALANSITEDIWELNDERKFTSGPRLCPMNLDELLPDYAQFQAHKYEMHGI